LLTLDHGSISFNEVVFILSRCFFLLPSACQRQLQCYKDFWSNWCVLTLLNILTNVACKEKFSVYSYVSVIFVLFYCVVCVLTWDASALKRYCVFCHIRVQVALKS
jgi:hypothetical protein